MATSFKRKLFFLMFCLASILQGMYSTYFVSILTIIERTYQIQSKTAGAIMSATEVGQISGSLLIAYYGGKGNKPKWIASCMTLVAIAALISTSPYFLFRLSNLPETSSGNPQSDLSLTSTETTSTPWSSTTQAPKLTDLLPKVKLNLPTQDQLCNLPNLVGPNALNSTYPSNPSTLPLVDGATITSSRNSSASYALVIFSLCLMAIGFGSTAITTLGIPFIDDIVSREESPMYLGLTIGLKIFGPALGFLLGSFCIRLDPNVFSSPTTHEAFTGAAHLESQLTETVTHYATDSNIGAWWLGPIIISLPLLLLALPMYYLSRMILTNDQSACDFEGITYQPAEDHDIGGSRDFQTHVLTICDLDVTSNQTCYSEVDSSSREVLQVAGKSTVSSSASRNNNAQNFCRFNFNKNLTLERPIITKDSILSTSSKIKNQERDKDNDDVNEDQDIDENWRATSCLIVNNFGRALESTSFTNGDAQSLESSPSSSSSSSSRPPIAAFVTPSPTPSSSSRQHSSPTMDLAGSLSRLIKNRLLLLRMLSAILHILPIAGFYTFLPKYLVEQFRIAPSSASAISGFAGILFVGFGAFLGGTIVRILNVNSRLMTRWIASSALLYVFGMLILMNLGCAQNQTVYHESSQFTSTDCLANCQCSGNVFSPVCANGTTYLSPCLAGCKSYTTFEDRITFEECGCSSVQIGGRQLADAYQTPDAYGNDPQVVAAAAAVMNLSSAASNEQHINRNVATQGHCLMDCDNLIWYIIVFSIFTLIHASCEVGSVMFNLRCVRTGDRTLALGLMTFASSLLGTIPCSVIYGTMIDFTCVHWDALTDSNSTAALGNHEQGSLTRGACRAYENEHFRYYLHGATAFVMFIAFLVDCIVSRRADEVDFYGSGGIGVDDSGKDDLKSASSRPDIETSAATLAHKKSIETF